MDINQVFLQGTVSSVSPPVHLKNKQLELRFKLSTHSDNLDKENTQIHQVYLRLCSKDPSLDNYLPLLNVGTSIFVKGVLKTSIYIDALGKSYTVSRVQAMHLESLKNLRSILKPNFFSIQRI